MKFPPRLLRLRQTARLLRLLLPLGWLVLPLVYGAASAQSLCASDDQPRPVALVERFISADCETCWAQGQTAETVAPSPGGTVVLDWIVPSAHGDDAPLGPAARRDALTRLEQLGWAEKTATLTAELRHTATMQLEPAQRLRVAYGLQVGDYVAASLEWRNTAPGPWQGILALIEDIPANTEGTSMARHIVRNVLVTDWGSALAISGYNAQRQSYYISRPMWLPEGTQWQRLRSVGWVQDGQGRIVALVQSAQCSPP